MLISTKGFLRSEEAVGSNLKGKVGLGITDESFVGDLSIIKSSGEVRCLAIQVFL